MAAQLASKMLRPLDLHDIAGFMRWFSESDDSPWTECHLNYILGTGYGEPDDDEPDDDEPDDGEDDGEPDEDEPDDGEPDDGERDDGEPDGGKRDDGKRDDDEPDGGEPDSDEPDDDEPDDGKPDDDEPDDDELDEVDVKSMVPFIKHVLHEANLSMDNVITGVARDQADAVVEKTAVAGFDAVLKDNSIIYEISREGMDSAYMCMAGAAYSFSLRTEMLIQSAFVKLSVAAYLTIGSIVTCSSQITSLLDMNNKQITPFEPLELSTMAEFVTYIQDYLSLLHRQCQVEIEGTEPYKRFCDHMLEMARTEDNVTILKELISSKDDKQQQPLLVLGGSCQERVGIEEVLKRKTVLLLISGLDIVKENLLALDKIYPETKTNSDLLYEIVWIPAVNSLTPLDEVSRKQFEEMQKIMPWYVVADPWLLDPAFIRYMEEQWSFGGKKILVVLDPQGKVVCKNALDRVMLWGNVAYPFTDAKEQSLWKEQTWKLEFLLNGIYPAIWEWISQGKAIWLYGGKDLEWARKFTALAKDCAKRFDITMEMLYVGHCWASEEELDKIISAIETGEVLGHYLPMNSIRYFWTRLERIRPLMRGHAQDKNIIKEVHELFYLQRYDEGWCVNNEGSTKMSIIRGRTILRFFTDAEPPPQTSSTDYESLLEYLWQYSSRMGRMRFMSGESVWENRRLVVLCEGCGRPKRTFIKHVCKLLTTQAIQAESSADSTSTTSATATTNN